MKTASTFPTYSIKGKQVEYKSFHFEVKSIDEDAGTVTGYLSTYGNVDLQKDRVLSGAFKKTIADAYGRVKSGRKVLFAILWMHDPDVPIGGFTDAKEDSEGLLCTAELDITTNAAGIPNNPAATMVFSGFKRGYIDELSMGYIAIQKEYVDGIRNLKECQLIEGSAVTMLFAANPEALVPASGVKSLQTKGVTGDTSLPIGPRNESWDSSKAKKQIFAYAESDDGTLDTAKLHDCFLYTDGDPQLKGSYSYPYVYIKSGKPTICVGAVISCVAAVQGSRGASAPDGLKAPLEKLYSRINKLYPTASQLTPPWDDDSGKRRPMSTQVKDFETLFAIAQQKDCLEDWGDLLNTFTQTMLQIHGMGDSPVPDMADALSQFSVRLNEWNEKAIACNLGDYVNNQGYCNGSQPYVPYSLQVGYMARTDKPSVKSGASFSAANKEMLAEKAKAVSDAIAEHKAMMSDHLDQVQQKVSDLTEIWQQEGQGDPYSNDTDTSKSRFGSDTRREPLPALTRTPATKNVTQPPEQGTDEVTLADLEAMLI